MTEPTAVEIPTPRLASEAVERAFGHRLRVRVAGFLFDSATAPSRVLLLQHDGLWDDGPFWSPPGGAVEFGESLEEALRREFREEAGLDVRVGPLRYTLDFIRPPLHAVSFYFQVYADGDLAALEARLHLGDDPELEADGVNLLTAARFVPFAELPGLRVYPDGFNRRLPADAVAGFPAGTQFLGTLR